MKKSILCCLFALCLLAGCVPSRMSTAPTTAATEPTVCTTAATEPTAPATEPVTEPATEPTHSPLYISGLGVEDVIRYFNEVVLNAEFINSGDPTKLQKWNAPISYRCNGAATASDRDMLQLFTDWLNTVEGFPGIREAGENEAANLHIYFCEEAAYLEQMGDNFAGTDGGVTFWYNGADEIYDAIIGYRTDIDQHTRNSVILEEIYNGLGPVNDTALRPDSVIYTEYTTPQALSPEDELILKLLYHPQMKCGMDAAQCEAVIRQLYY